MELNKTDIVQIVGMIKANYSYAYKDVNKEIMTAMINTWYGSLKKYPSELVKEAFRLCLETCKNPPSLADIVTQINKINKSLSPSASELWAELYDAILKSARLTSLFNMNYRLDNGLTQGQDSRKKVNDIFNNLSQPVKRYVSNVKVLINMTKYTDEEIAYEKGRFFKMIEQIQDSIIICQSIQIDTHHLTLIDNKNSTE